MDLTEEQLAKIQDFRLAFHKAILPLQSTIQTHYLQLRTLYAKNTEQGIIDEKIAQIDKLEIEMEQMFMDHQEQVRNLLTDEQKALFDQWGGLGLGMAGMGFGMGPGMGYGRGFGRGFGAGFGRGFGRGFGGYGRGYAGYGRGYAGYGRGYAGYGRGWFRGQGMGRGYWCPWFQQRRSFRPFNWRRN
jgi:hypothetical protein